MSDNTIKTLDGSTFLVSTPNGDIDARPDQPEGLFFKDTRHLSKWTLSLNGLALDVLSTDTIVLLRTALLRSPDRYHLQEPHALRRPATFRRQRFRGRRDGAQPQQRSSERRIAVGFRR